MADSASPTSPFPLFSKQMSSLSSASDIISSHLTSRRKPLHQIQQKLASINAGASTTTFSMGIATPPSSAASGADTNATTVHIKEEVGMHKHLTTTSLTLLGIGCIIGAGIFVITGQAAAFAAGPALALSFVLSAVACFFCGLCYAEMAAAIPISGSAYTFTYVAIGEYAAWVVAVCLVLEYLVSTATVTVGWSANVQSFAAEFGLSIPTVLSKAPLAIAESGAISFSGSIINLPAVFINLTLTTILCWGVKESTTVNNIFVAIKLTVLAIFVGFGCHFALTNTEEFKDNLTPFIPENTSGEFGKFGFTGVLRGAGMVFFSYVGFDAVCAMAQECKNPSRDLPRGLIYALISCTVMYVLATVSLTGMVKYNLLGVDDPVPTALAHIKAPAMIRYLVDIGAISGLTSCCLVAQMCTPRLLYTLSVDGLIPQLFGEIHPSYKTPFFSTIFCGSVSAIISGLLPLGVLGEVVSAGTLMAFIMVSVSVIVFRRQFPDFPRPFKVPFVPLFPLIGVVLCLLQMLSLPFRTILYYTILQTLMFAFYCYYSKDRSIVGKLIAAATPTTSSSANVNEKHIDVQSQKNKDDDGVVHQQDGRPHAIGNVAVGEKELSVIVSREIASAPVGGNKDSQVHQ